jgi:hypothetical protein
MLMMQTEWRRQTTREREREREREERGAQTETCSDDRYLAQNHITYLWYVCLRQITRAVWFGILFIFLGFS